MSRPRIPARLEGSHHDTVSMHCLDSGGEQAYGVLREQLYAINRWQELNEAIGTEFRLCDERGTMLDRTPRPGDCIRIDLAGPGSPSGGGYDWVSISSIAEEAGRWASLTIKPCANPTGDRDDVAHFYARGATNTFVVRRLGNCLLAEVHGRNERPNVTTGPLLDRLRNEAVAMAGKIGIGKVQWKDWTDGMLSVIQQEADGEAGLE